jgi:aconitate hydratase 2/2-methylisocitrate dehydratase
MSSKTYACLGFSADFSDAVLSAILPLIQNLLMLKHIVNFPPLLLTEAVFPYAQGMALFSSWLNRLLLPDTVGTGGDSHTRFPIGISSLRALGLVAFAAATGVMPLDMPESVLVRFKGTMQPGVTLRDLVNAIPLYAIKQGLLTVEKKGKRIFSQAVSSKLKDCLI